MEQPSAIHAFISRWQASGAAERANYQLFLSELCDQLTVARPDPTQADEARNDYVFERKVIFHNGDGSTNVGFIDLYKRSCFVLEAKQGSEKKDKGTGDAANLLFDDAPAKSKRKGTAVRGTKGWDEAILKARGQAERYARELPASDGWPPFLVIVDVGYSIELYADFTRSGKTYLPFPDARSHRILLADLARPEIQQRLRLVWTQPLELDPSRRSALVTREVAHKLAALAKSFEASGHAPDTVAHFLMRCLFTMFAEDVRLIPKGKFTALLESLHDEVSIFPAMISSLWQTMNDGGFSPLLKAHVLKFNGGLFADCQALPISIAQLELLIEASKSDWREVEPAIFGTLLERALDPIERHKLGAHYTPRAYVERLVMPTIIDPLREEWNAVKAAAVTLARNDKLDDAVAEVRAFHRRLCDLRVLDPACGSGNFLYVTLEHLKRLEGEVIAALDDFGDRQGFFEIEEFTVDPHQLLGLEINPRAAAIADLVLWIGYLQWHFRTRGEALPREPVLKKFRNIECRDAVLDYDAKEIVKDEHRQAVTRWDGRTYKKREDVPDETARVPLFAYRNARPAEWPAADYIIGNPPFIGTARMRATLGDGYTEALRKIYGDIGESSDYVMYWWDKAAHLARAGNIKRFGLIATNSLRQTFNRRVIQNHLAANNPLSLLFAIPDHPWVDAAEGAAVRISMTVATAGEHEGVLQKVISEYAPEGLGAQAARLLFAREATQTNVVRENAKDEAVAVASRRTRVSLHALAAGETPALPGAARDDSVAVELATQRGKIFADLTIGADIVGTVELAANVGIAIKGLELGSQGFLIEKEEGDGWLEEDSTLKRILRPYMNGNDLKLGHWSRYVIDFFGLSQGDARKYPRAYQQVYDRVIADRAVNRDDRLIKNWWLFRRSGADLRDAVKQLNRYIATTRTAKFRVFQFLPCDLAAESKIVVIALDDGFALGVLSSQIHIIFSLSTGGWLGIGNDPTYNHTDCFNKFPFPECTADQKEKIRALGEQLDAHRKRQQALHPALTMTDMYNVLEKWRALEVRQTSSLSSASDQSAAGGTLRQTEDLTDKDKRIHEDELVSVLKQLHDELDAAVAEAYGWPANLSDEEIRARLVALNAERAAEEKRGLVRWLRPEYQNLAGASQSSFELGDAPTEVGTPSKQEKQAWPKSLAEQARAVQSALSAVQRVITAAELAKGFKAARTDRVEELLQTLVSLGQAREVEVGKYSV